MVEFGDGAGGVIFNLRGVFLSSCHIRGFCSALKHIVLQKKTEESCGHLFIPMVKRRN